jgi:hypothetical protein
MLYHVSRSLAGVSDSIGIDSSERDTGFRVKATANTIANPIPKLLVCRV